MSKCKHETEYSDNKIRCAKDGSLRTVGKGCPCRGYEDTWFAKLKKKLFGKEK